MNPPVQTLNDGTLIPRLGYGLWQVEPDASAPLVAHALRTGYRLIDTAEAYYNEEDVGDGIRASGIPREEVFVTTKVWNTHHGYEQTLRAFDASLQRLSLDRIDLYLMHWPSRIRQPVIEGNADAATDKNAVCGACHGPDGNSLVPDFPSLAGQSATYLYLQLRAFKTGARPSEVMKPQVDALSDQDLKDLAAYYASLRPKASGQPVPDAGADVGRDLFTRGDVTVRRKLIRRGQRAVTARLQLGASKAVLGVPASVVAGSVLPLEDLWGLAAVQRLLGQLVGVSETIEAVRTIEASIAARLSCAKVPDVGMSLAREAAERLVGARMSSVAASLGVSDRHLRRVFREAIGMSPKQFARLARFRQALRAARNESRPGWAGIAATAGYFDQAHLIADFRAIAGVAPRALLSELGGAEGAG
jgi:cytochrome c553/AraC-like DNA-binding protein